MEKQKDYDCMACSFLKAFSTIDMKWGKPPLRFHGTVSGGGGHQNMIGAYCSVCGKGIKIVPGPDRIHKCDDCKPPIFKLDDGIIKEMMGFMHFLASTTDEETESPPNPQVTPTDDFKKLVQPLHEYLIKHYNQHAKIIITTDGAELLEGAMGITLSPDKD